MSERRWHVAKDPFTAIMRVAKDEMKAEVVALQVGTLLAKHSEAFDLDDFLAELAAGTGVLVQHKSMVPEWRATYDE